MALVVEECDHVIRSLMQLYLHLGITERTVRAYLTNIYTKLNVDSRSSAVAVAMKQGLLLHQREEGRNSQ
ncbi:MAG: hypothetical protein NVS4B11_33310 [Ktedonobacteraceae bacterium]